MSLKLMKGRNGKLRKHWYGKITLDGKTSVVNLGIPVRGSVPATLRDLGDRVFENSRGKAQQKLEELLREASNKRQGQKTLERLYEFQTGQKVDYVKLGELAQRWRSRNGPTRSEAYLKGCDAIFRRFIVFLREKYPNVEYLHQVNEDIAQEYVDLISEILAPKTVRSHLVTLKGSFRRFNQLQVNPFENAVSSVKDRTQIHRRALTVDELNRLISLAEEHDPEIVDAIRCCAYTGLRKGDVMRLKWASVEQNCLRVQTSKTGAEVVIPIFPPMREVLDRNQGRDDEYVFPDLSHLYEADAHALTIRFKKIALRLDADAEDLPTKSESEILRDGFKYIKEFVPEARRERVRDNFARYLAGEGYNEIAKETGRNKSAISYDLHEVEEGMGYPFLRWRKGESLRSRLHATRKTRSRGIRRGSRLDWHALRTTFASIALENGMTEGNLLSITGHTSMQTVIRHYREIREAERNREYEKLPGFFTGVTDKS